MRRGRQGAPAHTEAATPDEVRGPCSLQVVLGPFKNRNRKLYTIRNVGFCVNVAFTVLKKILGSRHYRLKTYCLNVWNVNYT